MIKNLIISRPIFTEPFALFFTCCGGRNISSRNKVISESDIVDEKIL